MSVAAIIGGGVIGSGWAARFALHGWQVNFYDPSPNAKDTLAEVIQRAHQAMTALDNHLPAPGEIIHCASIADAASRALWIQESTPERLELKRAVINEIQQACQIQAVVASSTSGFMPKELHEDAIRPEQIIVAHPYNPVYLLPLVECVGADAVASGVMDFAQSTMLSVGMKPVVLHAQVPAHVGDRLLEALWREALWLVKDGVATTEQIDDIITHSFGLRWAQKGLFENYRIAGGKAGMQHFLEQFGPCLQWPWSRLTDVPEMDQALIDLIKAQSDQQAQGRSIGDLEDERDASLVAILQALQEQDSGAGAFLNQRQQKKP